MLCIYLFNYYETEKKEGKNKNKKMEGKIRQTISIYMLYYALNNLITIVTAPLHIGHFCLPFIYKFLQLAHKH